MVSDEEFAALLKDALWRLTTRPDNRQWSPLENIVYNALHAKATAVITERLTRDTAVLASIEKVYTEVMAKLNDEEWRKKTVDKTAELFADKLARYIE